MHAQLIDINNGAVGGGLKWVLIICWVLRIAARSEARRDFSPAMRENVSHHWPPASRQTRK